jgi:hypothetical protein
LKKFLLILFSFFTGYLAIGQTDTNGTVNTTTTDTSIKVSTAIPRPLKKRIIKPVVRPAVADSIRLRDSLFARDSVLARDIQKARIDSGVVIQQAVRQVIVKKPIDSIYLKILDNPFFRTKAEPVFLVIDEKQRTTKDELFYLMAGLLIFLAFIKLVFARFFTNLFRLFFQPSFRQKQTREQMQQNNLPSLLLNLLFVFSAGAYISFLLRYYHFADYSFWQLFSYSVAALALIYIGKFIFLNFAGWVFNVKEATDAYIFAVYLINKILAVILIPFTLVIAFSAPEIINICITISILIIILLFIYRYLVSYSPISRDVKVSPLHFFFYICAFEIMPLLLIYKTLLIYLNNSL